MSLRPCPRDNTPRVTCIFLCNMLLRHVPATCRTNSNQFEFMRHVAGTECCTHIRSPRVTCSCDMSLRLICKSANHGLLCECKMADWSANATRMLIEYYKANPILWDKSERDYGNKSKIKKVIAPLLAKFEKTTPPRSHEEIKARWHNLRSSFLRNLKKPAADVKWMFWEDLSFLHTTNDQKTNDQMWTSEETGK